LNSLSLELGKYFGIRVVVHWTFMLLLGFIVIWGLMNGSPLPSVLAQAAMIIAVFGCVLLHEFGHALAARLFGVETKDITLLPIGGVARLERMPEKPWEEFIVALAGPMVNVVIAGIIVSLLILGGGINQLLNLNTNLITNSFLLQLLVINVVLVLFNMLPAFPMDGGRVLRAVLAATMDYAQATRIAVRVGQGMAILFGVVGLFSGHFMLMLVAAFVFFGAMSEGRMVESRSRLRGIRAVDAMTANFGTLAASESLRWAAHKMMTTLQDDFPVIDDGRLVGMLHREDLRKAFEHAQAGTVVSDVMRTDFRTLEANDFLDQRFFEMNQERGSLPVISGGRLVGIVSLEHIERWLAVHTFLRQPQSRGPIPPKWTAKNSNPNSTPPGGGQVIDTILTDSGTWHPVRS